MFSKFFHFRCSLHLAFEPVFFHLMLAGLLVVFGGGLGRRAVLSQLAWMGLCWIVSDTFVQNFFKISDRN